MGTQNFDWCPKVSLILCFWWQFALIWRRPWRLFEQICDCEWNLGLPLHIWNKATVKARKTLDSSPPMEVRSSVSGDATEILLVHLLLKTKKGHTLTVQIDATLLWGNINHYQVPWEVNQQGAVLPGQHPCAQVSCCHDCGFKLDYPSMSPDLAPADFNLSWTWRSTCP